MATNIGQAKTRVPEMPAPNRGGFCGALQRTPPPMPAGLARRLANKENYGMGKVSNCVMEFGYSAILRILRWVSACAQ